MIFLNRISAKSILSYVKSLTVIFCDSSSVTVSCKPRKRAHAASIPNEGYAVIIIFFVTFSYFNYDIY